MAISHVTPIQTLGSEIGNAAALFLSYAAVPLGMLIILLYMTRQRDDEYWLAWPVAAFLAGFGNLGLGSIVVGLLYTHVRE